MFKEEREESQFEWNMLGDIEAGRPTLRRVLSWLPWLRTWTARAFRFAPSRSLSTTRGLLRVFYSLTRGRTSSSKKWTAGAPGIGSVVSPSIPNEAFG
jgi:hypothetical protein